MVPKWQWGRFGSGADLSDYHSDYQFLKRAGATAAPAQGSRHRANSQPRSHSRKIRGCEQDSGTSTSPDYRRQNGRTNQLKSMRLNIVIIEVIEKQ